MLSKLPWQQMVNFLCDDIQWTDDARALINGGIRLGERVTLPGSGTANIGEPGEL